MNIAVFDLDAVCCAQTARVVREFFGGEGARVTEVTALGDIPAAFGAETPDMLFVGVDCALGVEAARKIRALTGPGPPLFFVSRTDEYGPESYGLSALDYLKKPVAAERIREAVRRAQQYKRRDGIT